MRQFGSRQFHSADSASDLPAVGDVRAGVVFGGSLTGTAADFATPLADLEDLNLSAFETSSKCALDSYYENNGIRADYNGQAVTICLPSYRTMPAEENGARVMQEILMCRIRRYNGVLVPAKGDTIKVKRSGETRTYKLTETPTEADDQLEWELEFSRTIGRAAGGTKVLQYD